jgi:hypothetical protein
VQPADRGRDGRRTIGRWNLQEHPHRQPVQVGQGRGSSRDPRWRRVWPGDSPHSPSLRLNRDSRAASR